MLGQVVAALVGAVHATLHPGQFSVGHTRSASLVLDVPELEVSLMLATDGRKPIRLRLRLRCFRRCLVQGAGLSILQVDDLLCRNHSVSSLCGAWR